jgi:hypothetical protein
MFNDLIFSYDLPHNGQKYIELSNSTLKFLNLDYKRLKKEILRLYQYETEKTDADIILDLRHA